MTSGMTGGEGSDAAGGHSHKQSNIVIEEEVGAENENKSVHTKGSSKHYHKSSQDTEATKNVKELNEEDLFKLERQENEKAKKDLF